MSEPGEPHDEDLIAASSEPDPSALRATIESIRNYKSRLEHLASTSEAKEILDALGIDPKDHGTDDPKALLERWKRSAEGRPKPPGNPTAGPS